ncbi:reverse transcriptase domain-containing protein [Tanacetum coccineum]
MVTSMGIRHAKPYTLRGGPSMKLEQRLLKAWQLNNHSKNSLISSKPGRAHVCPISGAIRGTATTSLVETNPKMEPRPEPTRAATLPLPVAYPRIRRRGERKVGFEGAQSRGESRVERNTEGGRPLEETPRGNGGQSVNLTLLLAAHLGKGENGSMGLHERNNRTAGFIHGLRTRSLIEHLSTNLPSTYKGLMEKTYTWVKAREVATNGTSSDRRDNLESSKKSSWDNNRGHARAKKQRKIYPYRGPNHGFLPNLSKSLKEILATEKAARSFKPPPKMFGRKRSRYMSKIKKERTKSSDTPCGESKKDKGTTPAEAPILMMAKIIGRKVGELNMVSGRLMSLLWVPFEVLLRRLHGLPSKSKCRKMTKTKQPLRRRKESFASEVSLRLKNAGATYQRLVDKVFSHQIRRNLEAYIDDMVIKSTSEKEMLKNIQETLKRFQSINMKLTLKKCSFDVEEVPFLGHLITKKGIKANPLKVKAVTDLDQPRTLKDIQSLYGKLAALSQFLSKGAERSLAFFIVLKGCKDKKNIQVLQGAELNYPSLEKLVLALFQAARRLRRYFQAHTIRVLTNTPIKYPSRTTKEVPNSNCKWRLYIDGASNSDGSGAGLMLIDPEGKEYTYALRFEFETKNNEAESEALLVGLRIAQEMKIAKVAIFLDSQLLELEQESRRAKQAGINDLQTSHKGSASQSFDQKVNRGKRSFEGRYAGEEKLDGPHP